MSAGFEKCLSPNNVITVLMLHVDDLVTIYLVLADQTPQSLFASREALAGEGTQRTFSPAFSRSPTESPPAQPQHPRVELQLQSQRPPQPRSLR